MELHELTTDALLAAQNSLEKQLHAIHILLRLRQFEADYAELNAALRADQKATVVDASAAEAADQVK